MVVLSGLLLVVGYFSTSPQTAHAAACGGVQTSIVSCDQSPCPNNGEVTNGKCPDGSKPSTKAQDTGAWGILLVAINILTAGIGVAAVGGIVYGAILYTSAGGSEEQVKKAMGIIQNVVIGVIAYALMYSGLNFLIPGGLFN